MHASASCQVARLTRSLASCVQGYHQGRVAGHIPDAIIGSVKALLGILVRPTAGMTEWVSKGTHGLGLVCLGRDAILGSAQRRMRAPGSLMDEAPDVRYLPPPLLGSPPA